MTVFSPMDSWITATARTDESRTDDWLSVGLELLDQWQCGQDDSDGTAAGQPHLVAILAALSTLRPQPPDPPDPLVLAVWFHHAGSAPGVPSSSPVALERSATAAYDRICALGEPALAGEVARLVRGLGTARSAPDDVDAALLRAAHRAAASVNHLVAVPRVPPDQ